MNGIDLGIGMAVTGAVSPAGKQLGLGNRQSIDPNEDEEERRRRLLAQQSQKLGSSLSPAGAALLGGGIV